MHQMLWMQFWNCINKKKKPWNIIKNVFSVNTKIQKHHYITRSTISVHSKCSNCYFYEHYGDEYSFQKKSSQELGHFVGILLRLLMSFASQEKWELILQKICMRKRNCVQMYFDNFLQMRLVNSWLRNNSALRWIMSMIFRAVKCLFSESL